MKLIFTIILLVNCFYSWGLLNLPIIPSLREFFLQSLLDDYVGNFYDNIIIMRFEYYFMSNILKYIIRC